MSVPAQASPFDPTVQNRFPPQASFSSVVRTMIRESSKGLRVCLPAKIVGLSSSYTVDVQPLLQAQYQGSSGPITLPILAGVPVSMPCGGDFAVVLPLKVGDTGLVVFADRSLDTWLSGDGDLADPQDTRLHDITDGIFLPGLLTTTQGKQRNDSSGDLVVQNGSAHIRVKKNGHVAIGNAQADLAAQVKSLASQVSALAQSVATLPCVNGKPVDPSMGSVATAAKTIAAALGSIAGP